MTYKQEVSGSIPFISTNRNKLVSVRKRVYLLYAAAISELMGNGPFLMLRKHKLVNFLLPEPLSRRFAFQRFPYRG